MGARSVAAPDGRVWSVFGEQTTTEVGSDLADQALAGAPGAEVLVAVGAAFGGLLRRAFRFRPRAAFDVAVVAMAVGETRETWAWHRTPPESVDQVAEALQAGTPPQHIKVNGELPVRRTDGA